MSKCDILAHVGKTISNAKGVRKKWIKIKHYNNDVAIMVD